MRLYRNPRSRGETTAQPGRMNVAVAGMFFVVGLMLIVTGCGGGAAGESGPRDVRGPTAGGPGGPAEGIPEPITTDRGDIFNVTIYSSTGQIYVDKLEVEFNRRRGIHAFFGFYRDQYDELVTIPFRDLLRVDFLGPMPPAMFDQAIIGREDQDLRPENAFELRLTFRDNSQEEFFGIVPKLRGEKDFQLWEFSLNNHAQAIDYIEFGR